MALMLAFNENFNLEVISPIDMAVVEETDGTETLANAREVYTIGIDVNFRNWETSVPSKEATTALEVTVFELRKDATFKEIFVPGPGKTLNDFCIPQSQIKKFCQDHQKKLRQDGSALFLFMVGTDYFVAHVFFIERELGVIVYRFINPHVWYGAHRTCVVLPAVVSTSSTP